MKLWCASLLIGLTLSPVLPARAVEGGCPVGEVFFRNIGYGALAGAIVGGLLSVSQEREIEDVPPYLATGTLIGGGLGVIITGVELALSPGCSMGSSDYASQPGLHWQPLVALDPYEQKDVVGIKGIYNF